MKYFLFILLPLIISCSQVDPDLPTTELVSQVQQTYQIPALAVAIVTSDSLLETAISGKRSLDSDSLARLEDYFHVGSNAKSMTAFLAAELIERELLDWETQIGEVLPHMAEVGLPIYQKVTLQDLLSHQGGILPFTDLLALDTLPPFDGESNESHRRGFSWWLLQQPSPHVGQFDYSNGGYAVACAMLEKASGFGWERLMKRYVFNPMHIDAGFGWPIERKPDQVVGHYTPEGSTALKPHGRELDYHVNPLISAAGDVHISVLDFGKYLQEYLKGWQGKSELLSRESFQVLLDGENDYAMGWKNEVVKGHAINHHFGTTGLFYSCAVILRDEDIGFVIVANAANDAAKEGVRELREALIQKCLLANEI